MRILDELGRMRAAAEGRPGGVEGPDAREPQAPKEKKRKKEAKKDEKKEDERMKAKGADDVAASEERDEDEIMGRKGLDALYGGTGLNPNVKQRRRTLKKARRIAKGKRKRRRKRMTAVTQEALHRGQVGRKADSLPQNKNTKQFGGDAPLHSPPWPWGRRRIVS